MMSSLSRLLILALLAIFLAPRAWRNRLYRALPCGRAVRRAASSGLCPTRRQPVIASWTEDDLNKAARQLSPSLHRTEGRTRMLDDLLARYGALSQYKSIQFWSTMHQAWEPFVAQAGFTDGPAPISSRKTSSGGKEFYYCEINARTSAPSIRRGPNEWSTTRRSASVRARLHRRPQRGRRTSTG